MGLAAVLTAVDVVLYQGGLMVLVDDEVGDDRLALHRRRSGDGAAAHVDLYPDIVDLGVVADLFALGETAGIAQVRLDDAEGAVFKNGRQPQRE